MVTTLTRSTGMISKTQRSEAKAGESQHEHEGTANLFLSRLAGFGYGVGKAGIVLSAASRKRKMSCSRK
jgi:hypothetical protein